jgi:hypothetical protein
MKNLEDMIQDLDLEIARVKLFVNENGYHNGTAINAVVRRYRNELTALRSIMKGDLHEDRILNYRHVESDDHAD